MCCAPEYIYAEQITPDDRMTIPRVNSSAARFEDLRTFRLLTADKLLLMGPSTYIDMVESNADFGSLNYKIVHQSYSSVEAVENRVENFCKDYPEAEQYCEPLNDSFLLRILSMIKNEDESIIYIIGGPNLIQEIFRENWEYLARKKYDIDSSSIEISRTMLLTVYGPQTRMELQKFHSAKFIGPSMRSICDMYSDFGFPLTFRLPNHMYRPFENDTLTNTLWSFEGKPPNEILQNYVNIH